MYEFQAGPRSGHRLATHEASLNRSSSQKAQDLVSNYVNLFRFSSHRVRLLQTILACCTFLAWSSCSAIVLNKAASSLASNSAGELGIMTSASSSTAAMVKVHGRGGATATLSNLSCSNASLTGSVTDACTITLSGAAPSGGLSVSLSSSSGAVTVPTTVTVPANATSAGFTAAVSSVGTAQAVTLTASAGAVSKSFALQLNAFTPTLSINATSISFGSVVLNTSATQSVTLSSTGTAAVTISAATLAGTGFTMSGASFPATLNPGQAITLSVQFDPTIAGAMTGQLTITSNSSIRPTAAISLSGTGETVSHQVDLSWQAPSASSDPIAGYNVYRSSNGGSSYQRMNSSEVTQTTYVDTTVLGGQSYDFVVRSVDSSGVESAPSNMTGVTIP